MEHQDAYDKDRLAQREWGVAVRIGSRCAEPVHTVSIPPVEGSLRGDQSFKMGTMPVQTSAKKRWVTSAELVQLRVKE
jgi:hypothetical protein